MVITRGVVEGGASGVAATCSRDPKAEKLVWRKNNFELKKKVNIFPSAIFVFGFFFNF